VGHGHAHGPGHGRDGDRRRLHLVLILVLIYMVAELVGGLISGSLALLADAGHMFSDAGSLIVALLALRIGQRAASRTHTFGYQRAEILAALLNAATLIAVAGYICVEAYHRIGDPPPIAGGLMLVVAIGGLLVNLAGLWILGGGGEGESLNVRGAWLHVFADTLGSVGAIFAGVAVYAFGWLWADLIASVIIALLVLFSSGALLAQTVRVLMQAVPERIDIALLEAALGSVDGVIGVHDLHVWSLTSGREVMSAHLTVEPEADRRAIASAVHERLHLEFDLHHSTIQLDCPGECAPCRAPGAP
jgi:cobalt-zinc-cadmium efflux system protein